jgi:hypothetical protein
MIKLKKKIIRTKTKEKKAGQAHNTRWSCMPRPWYIYKAYMCRTKECPLS